MNPALIVVDMQRAFRSPESGWHCVGYDDAEAQVQRLAKQFAASSAPIVRTRFVRDPAEPGVWRDYYDHWAEFRLPRDHPQWELTDTAGPDDLTIDLPTFSKWGETLEQQTAPGQTLVVCGVATDCCVLATVLGAVDAGRRVVVPADACAGATSQVHDDALRLMSMLAPVVEITTTENVLGH